MKRKRYKIHVHKVVTNGRGGISFQSRRRQRIKSVKSYTFSNWHFVRAILMQIYFTSAVFSGNVTLNLHLHFNFTSVHRNNLPFVDCYEAYDCEVETFDCDSNPTQCNLASGRYGIWKTLWNTSEQNVFGKLKTWSKSVSRMHDLFLLPVRTGSTFLVDHSLLTAFP